MLSNVKYKMERITKKIKSTVNKTRKVRPNSAPRRENKFAIVPTVYRPG